VESYVEVGDARLWTARSGSGLPVVWCHGGPGLWDYLKPVAALTDDMATSYRYDQRGCGRSTGTGPFSVEQFVADLEALRGHFGCERWVVGGHSWGAMLALFYAVAHPQRTAGLVYISGVGINPSWRQDFVARRTARLGTAVLAELQELRKRAAATGTLEDERAFCELQWSCDFVDQTQARSHARAMFVDGARVNNDVDTQLWEDVQQRAGTDTLVGQVRGLDLPALIIHGALDLCPAWPAEELSELLPDARFVLLEEAGHFPWIEQSQAVATELRNFLQTLA
jgi:proline iminopeptidase